MSQIEDVMDGLMTAIRNSEEFIRYQAIKEKVHGFPKLESQITEFRKKNKVGGIVRLTAFILKSALVIELMGAIALFPVFFQEFGSLKGAWYALFHSISAFCNAGFDLMGIKTPFSSLTDYA